MSLITSSGPSNLKEYASQESPGATGADPGHGRAQVHLIICKKIEVISIIQPDPDINSKID